MSGFERPPNASEELFRSTQEEEEVGAIPDDLFGGSMGESIASSNASQSASPLNESQPNVTNDFPGDQFGGVQSPTPGDNTTGFTGFQEQESVYSGFQEQDDNLGFPGFEQDASSPGIAYQDNIFGDQSYSTSQNTTEDYSGFQEQETVFQDNSDGFKTETFQDDELSSAFEVKESNVVSSPGFPDDSGGLEIQGSSQSFPGFEGIESSPSNEEHNNNFVQESTTKPDLAGFQVEQGDVVESSLSPSDGLVQASEEPTNQSAWESFEPMPTRGDAVSENQLASQEPSNQDSAHAQWFGGEPSPQSPSNQSAEDTDAQQQHRIFGDPERTSPVPFESPNDVGNDESHSAPLFQVQTSPSQSPADFFSESADSNFGSHHVFHHEQQHQDASENQEEIPEEPFSATGPDHGETQLGEQNPSSPSGQSWHFQDSHEPSSPANQQSGGFALLPPSPNQDTEEEFQQQTGVSEVRDESGDAVEEDLSPEESHPISPTGTADASPSFESSSIEGKGQEQYRGFLEYGSEEVHGPFDAQQDSDLSQPMQSPHSPHQQHSPQSSPQSPQQPPHSPPQALHSPQQQSPPLSPQQQFPQSPQEQHSPQSPPQSPQQPPHSPHQALHSPQQQSPLQSPQEQFPQSPQQPPHSPHQALHSPQQQSPPQSPQQTPQQQSPPQSPQQTPQSAAEQEAIAEQQFSAEEQVASSSPQGEQAWEDPVQESVPPPLTSPTVLSAESLFGEQDKPFADDGGQSPPPPSSSALFGSPSSQGVEGFSGDMASPKTPPLSDNLFGGNQGGSDPFDTAALSSSSTADLFASSPTHSAPQRRDSASIFEDFSSGQQQQHHLFEQQQANAFQFQQSQQPQQPLGMTQNMPQNMHGYDGSQFESQQQYQHAYGMGEHQYYSETGSYSQESRPRHSSLGSYNSAGSQGYYPNPSPGYPGGYVDDNSSGQFADPGMMAQVEETSFQVESYDNTGQQQEYQMGGNAWSGHQESSPNEENNDVVFGMDFAGGQVNDGGSSEGTGVNMTSHVISGPTSPRSQALLTGIIPRRGSTSSTSSFNLLPENPIIGLGNIQRGDGRPAHALISWGFGGRLVTMFPETRVQLGFSSGGDPQGASQESEQEKKKKTSLRKGNVRIFNLRDVCPSQLEEMTKFHGPLVSPSPSSTTRVEQAQVEAFLEDEITAAASNSECGYANRVLWEVLRLLLQSQGDLQKPGVLQELLTILSEKNPDGKQEQEDSEGRLSQAFNLPAIQQGSPLSEEALRTAFSDIESLLMVGDREGAVVRAVESELWAQALVISNFVSVAAYRRVVERFVNATMPTASESRTLFMLFAGLGEKSLEDPQQASISPGMPSMSLSISSGEDVSGQQGIQPPHEAQSEHVDYIRTSWKRTLGALLANRTPGDTDVLTNLGDRLWKEVGSVEAAHVCFLAAGVPPTSTGGSRIVLVGGDHKSHQSHREFVNLDSIRRTEIYMHAQELRNSYFRVDAFQPYRLVYAMWLADAGAVKEAYEWVKSIQEVVKARSPTKKGSPRKSGPFPNAFQKQLKIFADRLMHCEPALFGSADSEQNQQNRGGWSTFLPFFRNKRDSKSSSKSSTNMDLQNHKQGSETPPSLHNPASSSFAPAPPTVSTGTRESFPPSAGPPNAHSGPPSFNTQPPPQLSSSMTSSSSSSSGVGPGGLMHQSQQGVANDAPAMEAREEDKGSSSKGSGESTEKEEKRSDAKGSGKSGGWFDNLRGKLREKTIQMFVPTGNAKIAKTGNDLEAYYDKDKGRWIFPGEEDAGGEGTAPKAPPKMSEMMRPSSAPSAGPNAPPGPGGSGPPSMPHFSAGKNLRKGAARARYVDPLMNSGNAIQRPDTAPGNGPGLPPPPMPPSGLPPMSVFTPPPMQPATMSQGFDGGNQQEEEAKMVQTS